jgi:hypothetical protein
MGERRAQNVAADPSETVDANFNGHIDSVPPSAFAISRLRRDRLR